LEWKHDFLVRGTVGKYTQVASSWSSLSSSSRTGTGVCVNLPATTGDSNGEIYRVNVERLPVYVMQSRTTYWSLLCSPFPRLLVRKCRPNVRESKSWWRLAF
jgi:hypothetical protein